MPPISLMVVAAVCLLAGVVVVGGETDGPVGEKIIPMSISMGGGGSPMAAGNPGYNGGLGPGPNDVAPPVDPFPMASRCITTGESFFLVSLLCLSPSPPLSLSPHYACQDTRATRVPSVARMPVTSSLPRLSVASLRDSSVTTSGRFTPTTTPAATRWSAPTSRPRD